jgi:hypothetical protein
MPYRTPTARRPATPTLTDPEWPASVVRREHHPGYDAPCLRLIDRLVRLQVRKQRISHDLDDGELRAPASEVTEQPFCTFQLAGAEVSGIVPNGGSARVLYRSPITQCDVIRRHDLLPIVERALAAGNELGWPAVSSVT